MIANFLRRILLKKLFLWQLLMILIIFCGLAVIYGSLVRHVVLGGNKLGKISPIINELSLVINYAFEIIDPYKSFKTNNKSAKEFNKPKLELTEIYKNSFEEDYILLARYDGEKKRSLVELIDIKNNQIIHQWQPDIKKINSFSKLNKKIINLETNFSNNRYNIIHPLLMKDGSILFHGMYSPLVKIDICSNYIWSIDDIFHHSIEIDNDGNIWTAIADTETNKIGFNDDYLAKVSEDGRILNKISISKLLNEIEYPFTNIYSGNDPIHINDIQPYISDEKNNSEKFFLSMRNISTIALYDNKKKEIIWAKQGNWVHQHDVDLLNKELVIFNNNLDSNKTQVLNFNEILLLDKNGKFIKKLYSDQMQKNNIATITEGLITEINDANIIVEDTKNGRLIKFSEKNLLWTYTNSFKGDNYRINWSRSIKKDKVDKIITQAKKCN
jgi:hypothetical protein